MRPRFRYTPMTHTNPQRGFGLIEALIALVVLSIGLLGLVGLLVQGIKTNHNAYLRTQAVLLSNDMADRMLANRTGVRNAHYNAIDTTASSPANPSCVTTATGCTAQQMAQFDAYAWGRLLRSALPAGAGTVSGDGMGSVFTITVSWIEDGLQSSDLGTTTKSFSMSFQP